MSENAVLKFRSTKVRRHLVSTFRPEGGFSFTLMFTKEPTKLSVNDSSGVDALVSGTINVGIQNDSTGRQGYLQLLRALRKDGELTFKIDRSKKPAEATIVGWRDSEAECGP